jgi:hypothetical protein
MRRALPWLLVLTLVGGSLAAVIVLSPWAAQETPALPAASRVSVEIETRDEAGGLLAATAGLPETVDIVLAIDRAAELRRTSLGQGLVDLIDADGSLEDIERAWTALAGRLGYAGDEALDRLVGQRVVFASRALPGGSGQREWAVLSDVSRETESRLKQRLSVAPRTIDAGHQILSIEDGAYELTSNRRGGRVTLIMGPGGRSGLFDEIVAALGARSVRAAPLGTTDAFARAAEAGAPGGGPEVVVLMDLGPAGTQEDTGRWQDFLVMAGRRAGEEGSQDAARSWSTRVLVRDRARAPELLRIAPTSDAAFAALAEGALLAVVQSAPLSEALGPGSPVGTVLGQVPIPERARELTTGRQALSVRLVPALDGGERVACTIALETSSTGELAGVLDASMARAMQTVEQRLGVTAPPPRDFGGFLPRAARVMPVRVPEDSPLRTVTRRPLSVAWAYPGVDPGETPRGASGTWGWWAMSLVQGAEGEIPGAADVIAREGAALLSEGTGQAGGTVSRWIMLARVCPAGLEAHLTSVIPDFRSIRTTMRRFETVEARLRVTDEGDVQGDVSLRLSGPGSAAGGGKAGR